MRVPVGGDLIVAINGQSVTDFQALNVYLETYTRVGDVVKVKALYTEMRAGSTNDRHPNTAVAPES